jgi:hypothetical protein
MEKIKELENLKLDNSHLRDSKDNTKLEQEKEDINFIMENSHTSMMANQFNSINITELIEENENLKEKFSKVKILKDKLRNTKREKRFLCNEIASLNSKCYNITKIFTEGMHELSKELLKINEMQLDKIVQSKNYIT